MKGGHGTVLIIYLPLSWWPWQIPLNSWWPWQIPLIKQLLSMFPYCKLSFVKKGPCLMCIWWQKADKMQAVFFFFFNIWLGGGLPGSCKPHTGPWRAAWGSRAAVWPPPIYKNSHKGSDRSCGFMLQKWLTPLSMVESTPPNPNTILAAFLKTFFSVTTI